MIDRPAGFGALPAQGTPLAAANSDGMRVDPVSRRFGGRFPTSAATDDGTSAGAIRRRRGGTVVA